jgi:type II secretory pathway pseudopilin PulG
MNIKKAKRKTAEKGFSYIDVMIGLLILMIGILGATQALTANLLRSYESEKQVVAKQLALSTIESVFSAREIANPGSVEGWDAVGNVGNNLVAGVPKGVFMTGFRPIRDEIGADGVAGTPDDACDAPGNCTVNSYVNSSDVLTNFQRRIVITDVQDSERPSPPHAIARRRIDVTIRYFVNSLQRDQTISTMITNY